MDAFSGGASSMGSIPAMGIAESTLDGREAIKKNFEEFLVDQNIIDQSWPKTVHGLSEGQANDITLYERYAYWITYDKESSRGAAFALGSRKDYVRGAAQLLARRFSTPGSNLSKLEMPNNWMSKIVSNLFRLAIQRAADEGEVVNYF